MVDCGIVLAVENAMKMSPLVLPRGRSGARQAERGARREPLELTRRQRRVGRDDDDHRAFVIEVDVGRRAAARGSSPASGR